MKNVQETERCTSDNTENRQTCFGKDCSLHHKVVGFGAHKNTDLHGTRDCFATQTLQTSDISNPPELSWSASQNSFVHSWQVLIFIKTVCRDMLYDMNVCLFRNTDRPLLVKIFDITEWTWTIQYFTCFLRRQVMFLNWNAGARCSASERQRSESKAQNSTAVSVSEKC